MTKVPHVSHILSLKLPEDSCLSFISGCRDSKDWLPHRIIPGHEGANMNMLTTSLSRPNAWESSSPLRAWSPGQVCKCEHGAFGCHMMPLEIGLFGALPLCFPFSDDIILAWSLRVYFLSLRLVRLRVVLAGVIKSKSSPSSVSPISACPSELHWQEVQLCPANTQQDQLVTAAGTCSNIWIAYTHCLASQCLPVLLPILLKGIDFWSHCGPLKLTPFCLCAQYMHEVPKTQQDTLWQHTKKIQKVKVHHGSSAHEVLTVPSFTLPPWLPTISPPWWNGHSSMLTTKVCVETYPAWWYWPPLCPSAKLQLLGRAQSRQPRAGEQHL